jgi:hypothetical protein
VSVLRRSHDHHRDIPARLPAALPASGDPNRDQDRHVMIQVGARQIATLLFCVAGSRLVLTVLAIAPP